MLLEVIDLTYLLFAGNQAYNGAAVYASLNAFVEIDGALFLDNKASYAGGALYASDQTLIYAHNFTEFNNNTAVYGGAVTSTTECVPHFEDCTIVYACIHS